MGRITVTVPTGTPEPPAPPVKPAASKKAAENKESDNV